MIEIDDVHKNFTPPAPGVMGWFGRGHAATVTAVNGLSLRAEDGCITGLLGANGAGKTTALRMVAGLLAPDRGTLRVDGQVVCAGQVSTQARLGILSDARGLYPRLSARENIEYYGLLHGMSAAAARLRCEQLAHWLDMGHLLSRRCAGFSQGERMKTALARALVHDPHNIILDEPTNGLDVLATRALREFLRFLRSPAGGGKCIIFSTHIMPEVERLCDQVVVIAAGRAVARGSVAQLLAQAEEDDFENAFVKLAFSGTPSAHMGER